jgi:hypothetical protein
LARIFYGKNIKYPRFKKEWWVYGRMSHRMEGGRLGCQDPQEKSISAEVQLMIGNREDLQKIWSTLDVCFTHPKSTSQRHCCLLFISEEMRHLTTWP